MRKSENASRMKASHGIKERVKKTNKINTLDVLHQFCTRKKNEKMRINHVKRNHMRKYMHYVIVANRSYKSCDK